MINQGQVQGAVDIAPSGDSTLVGADLRGLAPEHVYLLHVHAGRCPGRGAITATYALPAATSDASGHLVNSGTINISWQPGRYILQIHAGATPGAGDYRQSICAQLG